MSVKPILFNSEVVRAILDGRKTVTRRRVKPQHLRVLDSPYHKEHPDVPDKVLLERLCEPPYRPGDVLWVRETWAHVKFGRGEWHYEYRASCEHPKKWSNGSFAEWSPSIHMPRAAARIWLRVMDVRVEQLQDIDEDGAQAEGLYVGWSSTPKSSKSCSARQAFMWLWDSTIKRADLYRYGWEANPFCWVIEFERCEKPEEA